MNKAKVLTHKQMKDNPNIFVQHWDDESERFNYQLADSVAEAQLNADHEHYLAEFAKVFNEEAILDIICDYYPSQFFPCDKCPEQPDGFFCNKVDKAKAIMNLSNVKVDKVQVWEKQRTVTSDNSDHAYNGTGQMADDKCEKCDGSGFVTAESYSLSGHHQGKLHRPINHKLEPCKVCHGTGKKQEKPQHWHVTGEIPD